MSPSFTANIDFAQVVLYVFWAFFFGLIFWLRREDRREGYPLESDNPRNVANVGPIMMAAPKTFLLPEGGEYQAPDYKRDTREFALERTSPAGGATSTPVGNPMLSGAGPAAWCARHDVPELTRDGRDAIIPMRAAEEFSMFAGPDPRGFPVLGADKKKVGTVREMWVDRADVLVRFLEVELEGGAVASEGDGEGATEKDVRLLPINMVLINGEYKKVTIEAMLAEQVKDTPTTKEADRITNLEEERICAYFAAARLYATPKRLGPVL